MTRWLAGVAVLGGLAVAGAHAHELTDRLVAEKTAAIARQPTIARLYFERAELHRDHDNWDLALADYRQATALDPALIEAELGQARTLLAAGWVQSARWSFERYLAARPTDAKGRRYYALALAKSGAREEAIAAYTRAIADAPAFDADLYLERARVVGGPDPASRQRLQAALAGLDEGIAAAGLPLVTLQMAAIELERKLGRFDAALARLTTVAAQSRRQEKWLVLKGDILRQAGRETEAQAAYTAALQAIAALPPHRRQTAAVIALEERAAAALNVRGDVAVNAQR